MENPLSLEVPLGITRIEDRLEWKYYAPFAKKVQIAIFPENNRNKMIVKDLKKDTSKSIWFGNTPIYGTEDTYTFIQDEKEVLDPYAKSLTTPHVWGKWEDSICCHFTYDAEFDWENAKKPKTPKSQLVIYEMHVRGFTKDSSSNVCSPGTYLGIVEKIPYLKALGVNAIELLPIYEFDERDNTRKNPHTQEQLYNYWGYAPIHFFCPMRRYASHSSRLSAIDELKTLVKECHKAGISVFLDVVYNHVGSTSSLLQNKEPYFILDQGNHTNYSGCGNTLSANSPATMHLIMHSLRYFAKEFQIDGFRFDLGACLTRDSRGKVLEKPPLMEMIEKDPLLQDVQMMMEPWDMQANLQNCFPLQDSWEWDGDFKRSIRQLSPDFFSMAYQAKNWTKIHYITCHDGFSLNDLVSYNNKHNENNGEENCDGEEQSFSQNFGHEGPTDDSLVEEKRKQHIKNLLFADFFCWGIVLLKMGDEVRKTHFGNNNPYCQDNEINYFLWQDVKNHEEIFSFVCEIIQLRKKIFAQEPLEQKVWVHAESVFVYDINHEYIVAYNIGNEPYDLPEEITQTYRVIFSTEKIDQKKIPAQASLIACKI